MIASHQENTTLESIGQIVKKIFAISIATYLLILYVSQFMGDIISDFIRLESFVLLILLGFVFTLFFYHHPTEERRMSVSDWALIAVITLIGAGMHLLLIYDLGLGSLLGSTFLFLLSIGLLLYVWNGRDDSVQFVMFDRDHRKKFTTYFHESRRQWIIALLFWLFVLAIVIGLNTLIWPQSDINDTDYTIDKDKAKDILVTPSILATPTIEEPSTITPTEEPQPTEVIPTPEPTAIIPPEQTPTPTPTPVQTSVDTSNFPSYYEVWVLNGSGVPGAAGEIRDRLEQNDIRVHYVGDESTFNYNVVTIRYNEGYKEVADAINTTLSPFHENISFAQFEPGERYSKYNIVVIHGA